MEEKKKIIIAGGTGFIGSALTKYLESKQFEVYILSRNSTKMELNPKKIHWDGETLGEWVQSLENVKAIINLSGKNINCKHTDTNKELLHASRINSTSILGEAIQNLENPPKVWINASGMSYYKSSQNQHTESNFEQGKGFISDLTKYWEDALYQSKTPLTRKIAIRIGLVLGNEGALKVLKKQTKLGLGGTHGSGNQIMSWIHIHDILKSIEFIIQNQSIEGSVNLTSPNPVSDKLFMQKLRKSMNIRIGLPAPEFAIKIGAKILGTEPELILGSLNVYPEKLISSGYSFEFKDLNDALKDLV